MKATNILDPNYFHKVVDCQWACPSHTPVPEYIRLIAQQRYTEAYMINWDSNVFPGILGRTCDRPCEPACRRVRTEEKPVAICRLKRVAADHKGDITEFLPRVPVEKNGKKIALLGAGPASLAVARDLLPFGYEIDMFDRDSAGGGMMRSQIPAFRLPADVLDEEVRDIAEDILANDNPDAMYVYFHNVDTQGHAHGGSSSQYRDAAETIDGHIGDLIDAVESRPAFNDENWLIMISSDHGHKDGGGHGGNSNHELSVYMVMGGPNVLFSINGATDNTYFAPPAMTHVLGYLDSEWNLDGQVVGVPISKASNPSPADGAGPTGTSEILSWNQGSDMVSQFVYFGTDSKPDAGELKNYQTSLSYNTGTLNTNTTYYWRIDTNTPNGTVTGDVWSFTTTSGNDLISYWRFDDGSGDTAFDQGPYNLDGTLNGASWTDGRFGGALYFDGNDYVTVGQQAELRVADGLTISAWVKPGSFDDNQEGIAGYAYDTGPNESGYWLQMNANGSFGFALDVTPGDMKFIETAGGYNTNTWYYVTATYDGQSIKLYVDGVLGATGSVNGNVDWYPDPAWGFQIGRWSDNDQDFRIDATIDEVGVWKRALSTNEIADVMTNGL